MTEVIFILYRELKTLYIFEIHEFSKKKDPQSVGFLILFARFKSILIYYSLLAFQSGTAENMKLS